MNRIFRGGPWTFDNQLLMLQRWKKGMSVENIRLEYASLWVQIWAAPLDIFSPQVASEVGNRLGTVKEVERRRRQDELNFFMRVRVALPISKPLRRGAYIADLDGARTWVKFKYERLPLFCYYCGFLRHDLKHCAKHFEAQKTGEGVQYQYGEWLKTNGGRSRFPSKRDMGNIDVGGAMDESEDLPRQTKHKLMQGRWGTAMTKQTQMGDSGDRSDNDRPDEGKAVIPRTVPEIQVVDSMNKGDSAYVKDANAENMGMLVRDAYVKDVSAENMGKGYGNIGDISESAYVKDVDVSNKESNPIWETHTLASITTGVDESAKLNLKGVKESQLDPISNELPVVRPKSTWTRINRMDFGLGGFTKNLVLPTLGKREASQIVTPNLDVSHAAPSLKKGKFDEVNIDEISAGVESHPCRKQ